MDEGLQQFANQAFVQLVVNVLGCGVLFCFYYNYRVLEAYFLALFWATICSIPMFQLKTWLIQTLVAIFLGEKNARLQWFKASIVPYTSIRDFFFRDVPWCIQLCWRAMLLWCRPLQEMFVPDRIASRPFFGILIRCGLVTFIMRWQDSLRRYAFVPFTVGALYYALLILLRLYGTVAECCHLGGKNILVGASAWTHFQQMPLVRRLCDQGHEVFLSVAAKLLAEYVNSLLAICIMVCCVLASSLLLGFCSICFFQEAVLIWQSSHDFVLNNSFSRQTIIPVLQHVTSGLGNNTRIQDGYDLAYRWAEKNIADFEVMEYVLSDLWGESMSDPPCPVSPPLAAGYVSTCPTRVMESVPKNFTLTTNLIRSITRGNFTHAASLAPEAYVEIVALHESFSSGEVVTTILGTMVSSGGALVRVLTFSIVLCFHWLLSAFDFIIQAVVFCTALFYLLKARLSVLHYLDQLLKVIDSSRILFTCCERVLRAVLVSALKMSVFHSLFTYVLFSFYEIPVVYVPTAVTFLISLVPLVPPVIVPVMCVPYLWMNGHIWHAGIAFACNFCVWWSVSASIYAEIPESHPWLTGISVVLGVSHFGVRGAVLGPLLISVPLICAEMLVVFNSLHAAEDLRTTSFSEAMRSSLGEVMRTSFIRINSQSSRFSTQACHGTSSQERVPREIRADRARQMDLSQGTAGRHAKMKQLLIQKEKSLLLDEVCSPNQYKFLVPALHRSKRRSRMVPTQEVFYPGPMYPAVLSDFTSSSGFAHPLMSRPRPNVNARRYEQAARKPFRDQRPFEQAASYSSRVQDGRPLVPCIKASFRLKSRSEDDLQSLVPVRLRISRSCAF